MGDNMMHGQENTEQKFIEVSGGKLSYDITGKGPVVLCLPGIGDTRRVYERFAPGLVQAGYRVLTTDLRGNGQSLGNFASHTLADMANDIKAILDAENIGQAYLVAGSISGASAGLFTIQQPSRVAGLILFSPVFDSPSRLAMAPLIATLALPGLGATVWGAYFKTLYPKRPVDEDYLAHVKANLRQKGAIKSLNDMLWSRHLDEQVREVKVPTLIFFGTKDADFKSVPEEAARLRAELSQVQIELLEGFGHYTQREASELIMPKTLEWLANRAAK